MTAGSPRVAIVFMWYRCLLQVLPALILLPLLGFSNAHGNQGLTSGTLTLQASLLSGEPIEGVYFSIVDEAETSQTVTTDDTGKAVALYAAKGALTLPRIDIEGPEFIIARSNSSNTRGAQGVVAQVDFTLIPTDRERMTPQELAAFAQQPMAVLGDIHERWEAEKGDPSDMSILRMASFLEGMREEAIAFALPPVINDDELEETGDAPDPHGILVRLVDTHGNAVANRRVLLFGQVEDTGEVQVHTSERTNSRGLAKLEIRETGRLYRVEVPTSGDGLVARGPVFLGREEMIGRTAPRAIVLQRSHQLVSGVVFNGNRPASGVLIETATPGEPVLSTRVDESGFFQLGPVQGEQVTLAIRRTANSEPVHYIARPGSREHFIPLDLLLLAQDRR
ncbi:MAG: hypothetical protein JJU11_11305 [Candidatus Sumerlaeia bacterium]|nr:hypothetical protein [Candidatus Sumerlaeia bacterium]